MCKVACVANVNEKNREGVWTFLTLLGQLISYGNNDGLGYAAVDGQGKLFGEKWLVNETAFSGDLTTIKNVTKANVHKIYDSFGPVNRDDARAIILHTRAATCDRKIENTHPFVNDKQNPTIAILHNGIISNHMRFLKKYSTCDSEVFAHLEDRYKIGTDLANINKFIKQVQGWYTVLSLTVRPDGVPVMDAFTDTGLLCSYFVKELGTRIWSSQLRDVAEVARALQLTVTDPQQLKRGKAMRVSVASGDVLSVLHLAQGYEPVQEIKESGGGTVRVMSGNLDDENFRRRHFGALLKSDDKSPAKSEMGDQEPDWNDLGYIY